MKLFELLNEIPVVNLVPVVVSALNAFPKAWDSMSEEQKTETAKNLILAASKAAADYYGTKS